MKSLVIPNKSDEIKKTFISIIKIINHVLSMAVVVLVVRITLLKPIIMQKLDGMNIIIQLKVKNHQNAFKTISTNVLHRLLFQMLQKMLRPGRT